MANIVFTGFVYDDAGTGVSGATINLYDRNTTSPVRATTTTAADGSWTISHATEGRFDIEIVNGASKRRRMYDGISAVKRLPQRRGIAHVRQDVGQARAGRECPHHSFLLVLVARQNTHAPGSGVQQVARESRAE